MTPDGISFIDANILLSAHDRSDPRKQALAADLLHDLWARRIGVLSTQVLQEFYAVATRRWTPVMERQTAREVIAAYAAWVTQPVDAELILDATVAEETHRLSFWDAMIVEAARRAGAVRVYTEDLNHGQVINGVRIENPFA